MRVFLPWTSPLLPAVAARMIADHAAAAPDSRDADLSAWLIVVRGRAAERRLLTLLAIESQRIGRALIPPRIITPGALDDAMFDSEIPVAGAMAQRFAWTLTVQHAPPDLLARIWKTPEGEDRRIGVLTLGSMLDQTWRELAKSGADFREAFNALGKLQPDMVELEQDRWDALDQLHRDYRRILRSWDLADPSDHRAKLAKNGTPKAGVRVALAGIVELDPALVQLLRRLPEQPLVLIHAPESEAAGFDEWGRLNAEHWATKYCRFVRGEIHVVRGVKEQASRCAELIAGWRKCGLPGSAVTIAAPEAEAIPALLHGLRDAGIAARAAEGNAAARTSVFQFLSQFADFLDRPKNEPPLYASVAALVRHPDLAGIARRSARVLDEYFENHLPLRLLPDGSDPETNDGRIAAMLARLEKLRAIRSAHFAEDLTRVLLRIYGDRRANRVSAEGRALLRSLEAVRDALDELKAIPREAARELSPADLLRIVVETAGAAEIPEPEQSDAVELAGWLEAASDDAPALIVTSVFEGSLPQGATTEPLLVDSLRQRLGLPCRASRFARDQYTLHTVWMSRAAAGRFALIAPRRSASGLPTRPSRLLLGAHHGAELANRFLALAAETHTVSPMIKGAQGHLPPDPDPEKMRAFRIFSVTSFRTYLASPLLFYFKHVLRLAAHDDSAEELDGGMFGNAIHSVLQTFGERHLAKSDRPDADQIERELNDLLETYMARQFGEHALPPVRAQYRALDARLRIFATHQAAAFAEGWQIAYVENHSLTVPFPVRGAPPDVQLKGRIDRIDSHPDGRWRVIDYKSSSTAVKPDQAHFSSRTGAWKDLQLPLYMKLLPGIEIPGGRSVAPEKVELVYFNLPAKEEHAGITAPFDPSRIEEAWSAAEKIVTEVCSGLGCREAGDVNDREDPTFLALCGLNGLPTMSEEE